MSYHYLVGVGSNDIRSNEPGKLYLDSFFEFTDKDKENINNCRMLTKDELFKSSIEDSSAVFSCSHIIGNFQGILIRARVQGTILLHYESDHKLDRESFECWIKVTPFEELKKAKIF